MPITSATRLLRWLSICNNSLFDLFDANYLFMGRTCETRHRRPGLRFSSMPSYRQASRWTPTNALFKASMRKTHVSPALPVRDLSVSVSGLSGERGAGCTLLPTACSPLKAKRLRCTMEACSENLTGTGRARWVSRDEVYSHPAWQFRVAEEQTGASDELPRVRERGLRASGNLSALRSSLAAGPAAIARYGSSVSTAQ
jgi:hypothetical protein